MTRTVRYGLVTVAAPALWLLATSSAALAHHPMGGEAPATLMEGLLSGIGHPVIGIDHLAFIIAAGILVGLVAASMTVPLLFIAGTIVGCLLRASAGVELPGAEMVIAASVLVAGSLAMSRTTVTPALLAALFAVAGLFHGGAYAETVIGSEMTPVGAYLAGFGLIQFAILMAAATATRLALRASESMALQPRLAGAVVAGVGATFLVEHLEKLAFPGM